jgi:hypothetical protein
MRRSLRAVATALVLALSVTACSSGGGEGGGVLLPAQPEAIATGSIGDTSRLAVTPPADGALVGAYVKPAEGDFNDSGKVRAVDAFESKLGRRLDIVHTYRTWEDPFFADSDLEFIRRGQTIMASWSGADTRLIAAGHYDDTLRITAGQIRDMGRPIMLRWRFEMDRPNLQAEVWSGPDFVAAWKHIWQIFKDAGATNVSWVWCPTAKGFVDGVAPEFFPGDDFVDWLCITTYPGDVKQTVAPLSTLVKPFLVWAAQHRKPIVIGEYGIPKILPSEVRAAWLRDATTVYQMNPQIKGVIYFESDPGDRKESHHYELRDDPVALAAFAQMCNASYFNPNRRTLTS